MEKAWEHLDQLAENSHVLTLRLLQAIDCCHRTPRLRKRLAEIPLARFQVHLPGVKSKDLTYLLAGLMAVSGFEIQPSPPASLIHQMGEYLRAAEKLGISISQFLEGSLTAWDQIRPKSQDLVCSQLTSELQTCFPRLSEESALQSAHYLLANDLGRMVPVFPFHESQSVGPVTIVRPQTDLRWTVFSEPSDAFDTLYNHFPEIDWRSGNAVPKRIWFVGVRLLSPLSVCTSQVLKKSLSSLSYRATTRVRDKEKLLSLIFYNQKDVSLFQFNLRHYSKFSSIHHQFVPIVLADYRRGYPGWSGFFEPEIIQQAGL